ncbi:chloroplastic import inner membrane translocase subunit tim22-2 [Quercus suber]|uniref:Chloroplastic import inner membrane translocase subunit tim22-2 n=1 Tax=Quercus suber TaxID=58331 RepID=A0AAW0JQQ7_QUESU
MAITDSSKPDSESEIETNLSPNPNPNPNPSNALVPTPNGSAVCLMSLVVCILKRLRGKDDVINAGVAGCCTGLALSFPGAPQALLQSCLTFGAFSFVLEGLNKQQPALAEPFSLRKKSEHYHVHPSLALPLQLQFPLPDEMKGAFSAFCMSLKNRNRSSFPTSH